MIRNVICIIFLVVTLAACSISNSGQISSGSQGFPVATTLSSSYTPSPSSTQTSSSQSAYQTKTPDNQTTTSPFDLPRKCIKAHDYSPSGGDYDGILLDGDYRLTSFFYLETNTSVLVNGDSRSFASPSVSPDQKKYAYFDRLKSQIVVASAGGEIQHAFPVRSNWFDFLRWQNDEELLIQTTDFTLSGSDAPPDLVSLNTQTGEIRRLSPDFPHIDVINYSPWISTGVEYDPSLTLAVYTEVGTVYNYTLWDIAEKKKLVGIPFRISEPAWSPDGSKFIVNADDAQFYLVTREGAVSQVPAAPGSFHSSFSQFYSWSPDGKLVAYWLERDDVMLILWDTSTGKMIDTCITMGRKESIGKINMFKKNPVPLWSQDGRKLIVLTNISQDGKTWDVELIDLDRWVRMKISKNLKPVGWIFPVFPARRVLQPPFLHYP